jgi:hypothetical protein
MSVAKDLAGKKFGRLTAIKYVFSKNKNRYWLCKCVCGNEKIARTADLIAGKTKSCGCLQFEASQKSGLNSKKHGMTNTRIYNIWRRMKYRCYSKNADNYKDYGGRGITVCDEWKNDFKAFYNWSMQNVYKNNLSIDRIDVNGNYEPTNCRWATNLQQANNRRNNRFISYNNQKLTFAEWATKYNISKTTFCYRLKCGWSIEKILNTPPRSYNKSSFNVLH